MIRRAKRPIKLRCKRIQEKEKKNKKIIGYSDRESERRRVSFDTTYKAMWKEPMKG